MSFQTARTRAAPYYIHPLVYSSQANAHNFSHDDLREFAIEVLKIISM
uniref:Uncharacterized protein n=1 Tax=Arundo donax TaxID=35708 RepID=A0A0A8YBS0_ARUDO